MVYYLNSYFLRIVYNISKKSNDFCFRDVVQERLAKNNLTILRGVSRCHLANKKSKNCVVFNRKQKCFLFY